MDKQKYESPLDNPDLRAMMDAWIHLTPLQQKVILWKMYLLILRDRAWRFIQRINFTRKDG